MMCVRVSRICLATGVARSLFWQERGFRREELIGKWSSAWIFFHDTEESLEVIWRWPPFTS